MSPPSPVPTSWFPSTEATSVTRFSDYAYMSKHVLRVSSLLKHKWEVHYTHFALCLFHWNIMPYCI